MSTYKLHVLYEHGHDLLPFGSAQIRLLRPLTHPALRRSFSVTFDHEYYGQSVDAVMIDRFWRPKINLNMAMSIINDISRAGSSFIYSVDDNFFDLVTEPLDWKLTDELLDVFKFFLHSADGTIVTTSKLKDRLSDNTSRIFVIPNCLDERLLLDPGVYPLNRDVLNIGYMGTLTHDEDLKMIIPAILEIIDGYPGRAHFQVLGGVKSDSIRRVLEEHQVEMIPLDPAFIPYEKFLHWFQTNINWDIGLGPLRDTSFTRCKSDIKFLDYAAAGIPGIFSRVPAYANTVKHLETGYLVENTIRDWVDGITRMIEDEEMRARIASQAHQYVLAERTVNACAGIWVNTLKEILA